MSGLAFATVFACASTECHGERRSPRKRVVPHLIAPSFASSPGSQTRMSAGGTVATVAAGCRGQPGLVERRDLDQLEQLNPLH